MEPLCRKCPNDCKMEATKGFVMKYCGNAPEDKRVLEEKRSNNGRKKKTKSSKIIRQGGDEVVWNATDWKGKRNIKEAAKSPVEYERQECEVANL